MNAAIKTIYLPSRGLALKAGVSPGVITRQLAQGLLMPSFIVQYGASLVPVFHPDLAVDVILQAQTRGPRPIAK